MRLSMHILAAAAGAALAVGGVAVASPRNQENVGVQTRQLQPDDARLKSAAGNPCVWFKHAPRGIQLPDADAALSAWLYKVAVGCDTFGLH